MAFFSVEPFQNGVRWPSRAHRASGEAGCRHICIHSLLGCRLVRHRFFAQRDSIVPHRAAPEFSKKIPLECAGVYEQGEIGSGPEAPAEEGAFKLLDNVPEVSADNVLALDVNSRVKIVMLKAVFDAAQGTAPVKPLFSGVESSENSVSFKCTLPENHGADSVIRVC